VIKISPVEILTLAKKSILHEAFTLQNLAHSLDLSFVKAVTKLQQCSGRVVLTGIGKSALIGMKIAATFNSINVPASFMHAGDALHGDLGILQPKDVVVILSKSGETPEIRSLLPALKARGNVIISILGSRQNHVASNSDIVILTPIDQETDPHNLAPTASSMAQLAVGDALAICLIHLHDFKPGDFARLHPAGMLGKRLNLRVEDLSRKQDKPSVFQDANIQEVIVEISSKRMGATAVLNGSSNICGIITDGDLRRMLEKKKDYHTLSANDIMTRNPKTIDAAAKVQDALKLMNQYNITQLLVTTTDRYVGVIHIHDLINEGF
jgi:arabinose-5-phosphate isomerase